MTTRMKVVDDHTGREIPPGTRYYNLVIGGAAREDGTRLYRDVRTPTAVVDQVRSALAGAQVIRERHPDKYFPALTVEIHERTV